MIWGYARVSTTGQCLDRQLDALVAAGVDKDNIYTEKMSGTKSNRPRLKALKENVVSGDVVYIESLSRLSRSSADLLSLMQEFNAKGVTLISLKEKLDFSSAAGKMISQFLCVLSEFERETISERVREGVQSARERGRFGGRPPVNPRIIEKALALYEKRSLNVTEICRACGISRPTLYKALHQREDKEELEKIDSEKQ